MKERYRNPSVTIMVNEFQVAAAAALLAIGLRIHYIGDHGLGYAVGAVAVMVLFLAVSVDVDVGGPVIDEEEG